MELVYPVIDKSNNLKLDKPLYRKEGSSGVVPYCFFWQQN